MYEYQTPAKYRLYCKGCNAFIRRLNPDLNPAEAMPTASCYKCRIEVCGNCGAKGHEAGKCTAGSDEGDPFATFTDTKSCPKCSTTMYLYEGCNSCICRACLRPFCWICLAIDPAREHWVRGSPCPKWNTPDAANAQWLEPDTEELVYAHPAPGMLVPPELAHLPPSMAVPTQLVAGLLILLLYWQVGSSLYGISKGIL